MTEYKEPYLHWLPEDDADTDIELRLIRMINENHKIALSYRVLPRVQPSEVISGELYMIAVSGVSQSLGVADRWTRGGEAGVWVDGAWWASRHIKETWGPLPKFRLDGK